MKKVVPIMLTFLIILAAGYLTYQAIYNPIIISFAPTKQPAPTLWPGIQLIPKTDEMQLGNPLFSPDGDMIVAGKTIYPNPDYCIFCKPTYSEIYLITPSTNNVALFLQKENADFSVDAWFPDGRKIVVQSFSGGLESGIFLIDIRDTRSISAPEYFPIHGSVDWSSNGEAVVIFDQISYRRRELKIVDLITKEESLLYTIMGTDSEYIKLSGPSISPDAQTLAFSYGSSEVDNRSIDTEIYLLDIETKEIRQFTHDSSHDNNSPQFSPDGKMIAYQKYYQDMSEWRTVIVRLENGCELEIPLSDAYTSSWAPDSQNIVIGGNGIYLVDLKELFGDKFPSGIDCP